MKAMILAAGYGTRLKPLTETLPKALVPVSGTPLLEIIVQKLIHAGISEIIINTHHFADMVSQFLADKKYFGINIQISDESEILGTGGGIKKAAYFFDDGQPFLIHNVDVISDINLIEMTDFHKQSQALATLAVQQRNTTRYLLMDSENRLCGHRNISTGADNIVKKINQTPRPFAFNGIHILSPDIFRFMKKTGYFSIIETYLECAAGNEKIIGFKIGNTYWKDVGKLFALNEVEADIRKGIIRIQHPPGPLQRGNCKSPP